MVEILLIALTVAGFGTALAGLAWNGVAARRRALGGDEAARLVRERHEPEADLTIVNVERSAFRGRAVGFSWSDEIGFGELKRGVRDGSWRRSARLQQFLLVTAGALVGAMALTLLVGWLFRPAGPIVALLMVAFIAVQTARGFRRA